MKKQFFAFWVAMTLASCALAQVTVSAAWVRATVPQAKATGAFMQLQAAQDMRLVGVRSGVAGVAQLHRMDMSGQMMRMRAVAGIDLPAGKIVSLSSGGYHVMLMDLKRQLKEGESVPLTLVFENKRKQQGVIDISVPVMPLTYVAAAPVAPVASAAPGKPAAPAKPAPAAQH